MKKTKSIATKLGFGTLIGIVNGFFGAGGGLVCVPLLTKLKMDRKTAHANAVAVILPITIVSVIIYFLKGRMEITNSLIYIPGGIIGSVIGTYIMKKISPKLIRKIFALFMVWAGWRLLVK